MAEPVYHTDPDDRSLLYILYVEKATMVAAGYQNTPVVCRWYADNANHCSKEFTVTTNQESQAPYFAFMSISFQDMTQRQKYLTLTLSQPEGDHICVAWLDLQSFNVDALGQLDESGSFASQVVDLQTEQGVCARVDLHTAVQKRWTRDTELVPSFEPAFLEPRYDAQAEYLYVHIAGEPVPQEPDGGGAAAAAAAHAAAEEQARAEAAQAAAAADEERRRQEEADRARREDEKRKEEQRLQEEFDRARRQREDDELARRRREDEDRERSRLYSKGPGDTDRERRLYDENAREREREWERQRQREREEDQRELRRREEEDRYELQAARERRYFEEGRNLAPREDWYRDEGAQRRAAPTFDDHLSEASEPCEFVGDEVEHPMEEFAAEAHAAQRQSPRAGRRMPARTNRVYQRPEAPLNIRLDQIKALSTNPESNLYLVKHDGEAGLAIPEAVRAGGHLSSSDADAGGKVKGRTGHSPSSARHVSLEAGASRGQRRTGASPVHTALANALADVAGRGAVPGAAAEECILRLLVLQKELNASKAPDRLALQDAAAGVVPRMLQVLDVARATCERNQQRLESLSKEKGVDIEKLGGGAGYLQPQLKAIEKLHSQYSSLMAPRAVASNAVLQDAHTSGLGHQTAPPGYGCHHHQQQLHSTPARPVVEPLRSPSVSALGGGPSSISRPVTHSRSACLDPGAPGPQLPTLHAGAGSASSWPSSIPPQRHAVKNGNHTDMWNVSGPGHLHGQRAKPHPTTASTAVPSSAQTLEGDHDTMWTAIAQNISMSPGTRSVRSPLAGMSVVTSAVSTPRQNLLTHSSEPFLGQPQAPLRTALQQARGATEGFGPSSRSSRRQPRQETPSLGGGPVMEKRGLATPLDASRNSMEAKSLPSSSRMPKTSEDKYLKILRSLQAKSGVGGGGGGGLSAGLAARLLNKSEVGSASTSRRRNWTSRSMTNIMGDSESEFSDIVAAPQRRPLGFSRLMGAQRAVVS